MADYVNLVAALLALLGALFGLSQFFKFRTHRDRLHEIGESFKRLANGLGSNIQVERLSSAALLPRFFDAKSEFGLRDASYAYDAAKLAAGILKTEPTGVVQKTLADGLAEASSLAGIDFQRANLRNCFWGPRSDGRVVAAPKTDFFRADLSAASLRGADLHGSVFKSAQLVGTVLKQADLRGCNFDLANLRGASFDGASLAGASFVDSSNIPSVVADAISDGKYTGDVVPSSNSTGEKLDAHGRVFLSRPSECDRLSMVLIAQITQGVTMAGMELVDFPPDEYGMGAPLDEVKQRVSGCDGVVILGVPQIEADRAKWRGGATEERTVKKTFFATPWNHIEAGIAAGLDKPILIVRDEVTGGVFEIGDQPHAVTIADVRDANTLTSLDTIVSDWAKDLPVMADRPTLTVAL